MTPRRPNRPLQNVHRFAVFTVACTFLLLIAGALVTSNDAGLSVPDWPLSYGLLTPPMVGGIFYEHGHRMIASFFGILSIVLAVWLWRAETRGPARRRRNKKLWLRLLRVGPLGAVVVTGLLFWLAGALKGRFRGVPELRFAARGLHILIGLQLLLGAAAYWSRLYAASFPQPIPVMVALTVAHVVTGALVLVGTVLVTLVCFHLVRPAGAAVAAPPTRPRAAGVCFFDDKTCC